MSALPILINTRPTHRGDVIRAMSGVQVLDCPLLQIVDCPLDEQVDLWLDDWLMGRYAVLIVTSVESARRAIRHLTHRQIRPNATTPIVAVGTATAQVLRQHGLPVILPTTANNEGMLALPVIGRLAADERVLIWRGVGGRRLLHDDLVARGVQIDAIEWYERTLPADLPAQFHKIQSQLPKCSLPFVIISSQMAFENWLSLSHRHNYHYLPLGGRLARIVRQHLPDAAVTMIDDLSAKTLAKAMISQTAHQQACQS